MQIIHLQGEIIRINNTFLLYSFYIYYSPSLSLSLSVFSFLIRQTEAVSQTDVLPGQLCGSY
jgi:hypothetical protein